MFNKNQIEAISHNKGPAIVLAGPGSGKTTVITQRIKNLIETYHVPPEKILVVTFTKAAATQMQERFLKLMNGEKEAMNSYPITFGTFHSVYYKILRLVNNYKSDNIATDQQRYNYIKEIAIRRKVDVSSMSDFVQRAAGEISNIKGNMKELEQYHASCCSQENFVRIFQEYEKALSEDGKLDFDDMLLKCHQLLLERGDILEQWQKTFQYILIDEFQDINKVQYEIIKMIALPENNLFIVGDDDQSIYGFRGACPGIMFQFHQEFGNAKEIFLNMNYRSTPEIVKVAQNLIRNNEYRFDKKIISAKSHGVEPDIRRFRNQGEELKYVCEKIKEYIKNGIKMNEIAILIRNNSQSGAIKQFLQNEKIEVRAEKKKTSIYESMVAKDIIAYIKASLSDFNMPLRDNTDLIYILNKPARFISRQIIGQGNVNFAQLCQIYGHSPEVLKNIEQLQFHLKMISGLNPTAALVYIRNGTGYEKYLRECATQKNIKMENLLGQFDRMQNEAAKFTTLKGWLDDIESHNDGRAGGAHKNGVSIMTMHGAKGLEFKAVFIIDVNQGVIPSSRAMREKDFQEERRVFYVAVTRAIEFLNIYGVTESLGYPVELSMFISEILN